jgi:DNA-binding NtrC family response regulator
MSFESLPDDPEEALLAVAQQCVGRLGVKEAQKALRAAMFREALRQHSGNRHAAARALQIDRRYVLKMLKELTEFSRSA